MYTQIKIGMAMRIPDGEISKCVRFCWVSRRRQSNKLSLKKGDGGVGCRECIHTYCPISGDIIWKGLQQFLGNLPSATDKQMTSNSFDFIASYWFDVWKVLQTNSIALFHSFSIVHRNFWRSIRLLVIHTQAGDESNSNDRAAQKERNYGAESSLAVIS